MIDSNSTATKRGDSMNLSAQIYASVFVGPHLNISVLFIKLFVVNHSKENISSDHSNGWNLKALKSANQWKLNSIFKALCK